MSSARHRRLLREMAGKDLDEIVQVMLDLVPASVRKAKTLMGQPTDRWLRGFDSPAKHEAWIADMLQKLRSGGLSDRAAAVELRELLAAIHRIPSLNAHRFVDMLEGLRRGPNSQLAKLRSLMDALARPGGERGDSIAFVQWLMHKQFGDVGAGRLDLDALARHVPGFGSPPDAAKLRAFREAYDLARRRVRTTVMGEEFETLLVKFPGDFQRTLDLNTVKTDFPIFDAIVKDKSGATRFASLADGGFGYLVAQGGKIDAIVTPKPSLFSEVVERLMREARAGGAGLSSLAGASASKAERIIAERAVLLVHPASVEAARAVLASRVDFPELLNAYRKLTGRPSASGHDLLEVIQPAFKLD